MHPVAFRQRLESKEALQSELPVFCIFHPSAGAPCMRCYGSAPQDPSSRGGTLASDDSGAQLCGDGDEVKGRAGARHGDARDGHEIQGI